MVGIIRLFCSTITEIIESAEKYKDKRVEHLPFMNFKIFILVGLYYVFVKHVGPRFMENRKPYNLKWIIAAYNTLQIIYNIVMCVTIYNYSYRDANFSIRCESPNRVDDKFGREQAFAAYLYAFLKIIDLLDTVFFVLRKKNNQITFLHVYHHIVIVLGSWLALCYVPSGHNAFLGISNGFVHSIMYSYYLYTTFAINSEILQRWKKYLTQLQMLQFLLLIVHFGGPLLFPVENCTYPKWLMIILVTQNFFMLAMFFDFYIKAYINNKKSFKNK